MTDTTKPIEPDAGEEFDTWLASQPEESQTQYAAHIDALKGALKKERTMRKDLERGHTPPPPQESAELAEARKATETLQGELKTERTKSAIQAAAVKFGFAKPTDAVALVDMRDIMFDDDGNPDLKDVEEAVRQLSWEEPHLIGGKRQMRPVFNPGGAALGNTPIESDADRRKKLGY